MTDDRTPHEPTYPYEDALAARLEQATAGIDGDGVSRDGVRRAVAARTRDQRRRRTALVGVAAAVALLGGVAVAGTVGGDDTRVRTDDRADSPSPEPTCPGDDVAVDGGSFTGQGVEIDPDGTPAVGSVLGDTPGSMEGYTPTFGNEQPVTTLSEDELQSAATILQVLDQVDPDAYLAFVRSLSSDFTASPERQAFAQAVRALHPYTGPDGTSFPDGDQRRAVDEYAASLPGEVFVDGAPDPYPTYGSDDLDGAYALLRPLGIAEGELLVSLGTPELTWDETDDAFLALVRSGAAPDATGSYDQLTADQLATLDAYVARLPDDLFVNGQRLPRPRTGAGAFGDSTETTAPAEAGDQAAPTPVLSGGGRCEEIDVVIEGTSDTTAAVDPVPPTTTAVATATSTTVVPTATSTTVSVTGEGEPASGPGG